MNKHLVSAKYRSSNRKSKQEEIFDKEGEYVCSRVVFNGAFDGPQVSFKGNNMPVHRDAKNRWTFTEKVSKKSI